MYNCTSGLNEVFTVKSKVSLAGACVPTQEGIIRAGLVVVRRAGAAIGDDLSTGKVIVPGTPH